MGWDSGYDEGDIEQLKERGMFPEVDESCDDFEDYDDDYNE